LTGSAGIISKTGADRRLRISSRWYAQGIYVDSRFVARTAGGSQQNIIGRITGYQISKLPVGCCKWRQVRYVTGSLNINIFE
jgi:hypothetical protein